MSSEMAPAYISLFESGELRRRVDTAFQMLKACTVCPRKCRTTRLSGGIGACSAGLEIHVSSIGPHFGEEPPLTGTSGSGTVFFSHCNLHCLFCQNHQISQQGIGNEISYEDLADQYVELQELGCHNINLVSPTTWGPQIMKTVLLACERGLRIPLVYNSGGYDSFDMLRLFEGVVDIYLPDMKYGNSKSAAQLSGIQNYVIHNQACVREMFRQVGLLRLDENGIAQRGLIVRHLVLPNDKADSREVFRFLADELSEYIAVSLMSQYSPQYRAHSIPELNRPITRKEYETALRWFHESGLTGGYIQEMPSHETGLPDFAEDEPFDWSQK